MTALLDIRSLSAAYGKGVVLKDVDMHIGQGGIVALLGRNGAGRSTLLKALMGQVQATGHVRFLGRQILGMRPFDIARMGIGYVAEERALFANLTVEQNLILGEKSGFFSDWTIEYVYQRFPQLKKRAHVLAGVLSGGKQQLLALCRALVGKPRLLLIDEPTEGLAPQMIELIQACLIELQKGGMSILLVEQRLAFALDVSHRVYILGHGTIVLKALQLPCEAGLKKAPIGWE